MGLREGCGEELMLVREERLVRDGGGGEGEEGYDIVNYGLECSYVYTGGYHPPLSYRMLNARL